MAFALSIFAARLVQVQAVDSAAYRSAAERVQLATIQIPAVRGDIMSSNGTALAMTMQTYTVSLPDPKQIPGSQRPGVAARLAGPLGLPAATILGMLRSSVIAAVPGARAAASR